MKCPSLKSYVSNASANSDKATKIFGNYRGSDLDKQSFARAWRWVERKTIRNTEKK